MFHATSQKRALSHVISFAGNYRLFAHRDVSYRFNGESRVRINEKMCKMSGFID